jgi:CRISPR system Cascade subunit CasA
MAKVKTACFNLVDEPWLPVTLAEEFPRRADRGLLPRVGLREAFEHGDNIVDLRCYGHERIALIRLLICIAQRALDGPSDENGWKSSRHRLRPQVVAYLEQNKGCFNLFGDGPRFLQKKNNRKATTFSTQKFRFIDESTSTLFDAQVEPGCKLSAADLTVGLVTFQSFAAGGRVEGAAESLPGGLCREGSALHGFLLGDSLLESVWLNLVPKDQVVESKAMVFGDTSWHGERDAAKSYLYRLAPTARHLWLAEDGTSVEGRGGRTFLTFEKHEVRELTAAVRTVRKTGRSGASEAEALVSATAGGGVPKAAWRELHALALLRSARRRGGPLALQHCQSLQASRSRKILRLWCGALIGGGKGRAAAVGDVVESIFRLPIEFLEDADAVLAEDPRIRPGPNQTYRKGVEYAEIWAGRLQDAVYAYHARLADADRGKTVKNHAALWYWTVLGQRAERVLLHDVAVNSRNYWSSTDSWMAKSPWGEEVGHAARETFELSCPHATPRQLRAYAAGLEELLRPDSRRAASGGLVNEQVNRGDGEEQ